MKNECPFCVQGYMIKYQTVRIGKQIHKKPMRSSVCMSCKGTGIATPKFVKKSKEDPVENN